MKKIIWRSTCTALVLTGLVVGLFMWNMYAVYRLTDEALVARLTFKQLAPQIYEVELRTGDFCKSQQYQLYGDEWRVDARFLKWKPWANLAGMDALYRLERLTGRYQSIADENRLKHISHDISNAPSVDLIKMATQSWASWVPLDTLFGSSVFEAIDSDYEYRVYRTQSGLIVRKQSLNTAQYQNGRLTIEIVKDC